MCCVCLQMLCTCCATVSSCCPSTSPAHMWKTKCQRGSLSETLAELRTMSRMTSSATSMTTYTWSVTWLRSSVPQALLHWRIGRLESMDFNTYYEEYNKQLNLTTQIIFATPLWDRLRYQILVMLLDFLIKGVKWGSAKELLKQSRWRQALTMHWKTGTTDSSRRRRKKSAAFSLSLIPGLRCWFSIGLEPSLAHVCW